LHPARRCGLKPPVSTRNEKAACETFRMRYSGTRFAASAGGRVRRQRIRPKRTP